VCRGPIGFVVFSTKRAVYYRIFLTTGLLNIGGPVKGPVEQGVRGPARHLVCAFARHLVCVDNTF
jgi:hypothetical protein